MTNFDNLFYAILVVFQSVTLEGWSSIMVQIQQVSSFWSFIFFLPIIFIGSFFLLNLTLAVINSKFNDAHKEKSKEKGMHKSKLRKKQMEKAIQKESKTTENNFRRYFIAKRVAKRMVETLRKRQDERKGKS